MTNVIPATARAGSPPVLVVQRMIAAMQGLPDWFIALAARIFPAAEIPTEPLARQDTAASVALDKDGKAVCIRIPHFQPRPDPLAR